MIYYYKMTSYFSNLFTKNELSSEGESSEEDLSEGESSGEESSEGESSEEDSSEGETSSIDEISESEITLAEEQDITENNNYNINEELESSSSEEEKIEEQDITENTSIKETQEVNINEVNINERNIYKEFQCYASKKFLDAAKPYFKSPSFSFSKMMYLNGLKSKTEKDSAKEWIAAYRIQRWWKNLDKKKIDMAKKIKFNYSTIGFPFLYV